MDAADVVRVLDQLEDGGVAAWLDGGWGVDALWGGQSRAHQDLDLVVARDDCAAAREALAALGYAHDAAATTWACSPSGSGCRCRRASGTPLRPDRPGPAPQVQCIAPGR